MCCVTLHTSIASGTPACYLKSQLGRNYAVVCISVKKQSCRNDGPRVLRDLRVKTSSVDPVVIVACSGH